MTALLLASQLFLECNPVSKFNIGSATGYVTTWSGDAIIPPAHIDTPLDKRTKARKLLEEADHEEKCWGAREKLEKAVKEASK